MKRVFTVSLWVLLAALGAAWWVDKLVTVEWSYAYCNVLDDGPAGAVFGFPFPHTEASVVTSATDFFIPWLYALDLVLIAGLLFALSRPLASKLVKWNARLCSFLFAAVAVVLLGTAVPFEAWVLRNGIARPTDSFFGTSSYSELRPVALRGLGRKRDCTPSAFWFR